MESFFKEAIKSIKTSGTVRPSSKYLIRACLKDIDFSNAATIIEFGTGDGCFTHEIASRMQDGARLFSYEVNPKFYKYCSEIFCDKQNVEILNTSALDFDIQLKNNGIDKVDYFISSLPLALLKDADVQILLNKVGSHLKPGGLFIQYQYSLVQYRQLKKNFDKVQLDISIINLPPAIIYKCWNQ